MDADGKCDDCKVELIKVTFDYEDPSKEDVVVLWAKNGLRIDVNASLVPLDTKEGFVSDGWTLSETKTPEGSLDNSTGQTLMVGDAVYETKWLKYYDEIHFSFSGYELGADGYDWR